MREINLLRGYPEPTKPRYVSNNLRTIRHRLIASKRDQRFFDGDREFGYGGYQYDGRWRQIASNIITTYMILIMMKKFYKLIQKKDFYFMI